MGKEYYDETQELAGGIAVRTQALSFLLYHFNPEGHSDKDKESLNGVGALLEDIAKMASKLDLMLDSVNRPTFINAKKTLEKLAKESV